MALGNEHSRNEFLKALLSQKKELNANGGNLVNPAVNVNPIDDNNSRVVDTSYSDPLAPRTVTQEEKYKESRNGWQRFWDSVGNFISNINEGIAKYILDPIGDAGIYLYGAISGDHEGAKAAMNYDWTAQYMNVMNQLDIGTNIMSGDFFGADGGDYWRDWADTGNAVASRTNINKLHEASFSSDWGDFGKNTLQNIEQIGGAMLPSIILGIVTGGSSAGVQAAVLGTEAAVGTIAGFGQGVNTALNEGAEYGAAAGYGAINGAIQGVTTFVAGKTLAGGGVGAKAANAVFGKTGSIALSNATKIAVNAGIQGVAAGIRTAADPVWKQVTYDQQAIEKAYGSQSAAAETAKKIGQSIITAAAMSAVAQSVAEGVRYKIQGKETYTENFLKQYDYSQYRKAYKQYSKELSEVASEMDSISKQLDAYSKGMVEGRYTENEYGKLTKPLLDRFYELQEQGNTLADNFTHMTNTTKVDAKYGTQITASREDYAKKIVDSFNITQSSETRLIEKQLNELFDEGYTWNDIKNHLSKGNTTITPQKDYLRLSYTNPTTNETYNLPMTLDSGSGSALVPKTINQATDSIIYLGTVDNSDGTVQGAIIPISSFVSKGIEVPNNASGLTVNRDVAKAIQQDYSTEQIKEYFELIREHKGSSIIKDGDRYMIISKAVNGEDGEWHSAITYVDSKFKNIENIEVLPTKSINVSEIAKTSVAMAKANDEIMMSLPKESEPRYIKAYGDLNHERVLSMKKAEDIVDIVKKQIMDKIFPKKEGYEYQIKLLKGETAKRLFEDFNTLKESEIANAISELADDIANSKIVSFNPDRSVRQEFLAGHKDDFVKAITGLLKAKSELSRIAKLEKRFDLSLEKKNEQIAKIREKANERLAKAYEIFKSINNDLKSQIKEVKAKKDYTNFLSRNRSKIKDLAEGDYTYDKLEDRDVHTINMLSKLLASLERHGGTYKATDKTIEAISTANKIYTEENYEKSIMNYDDTIKRDLEELEVLLRGDLGKPELSLETYKALKQYNKDLLAYEQKMVRRVIPERRSRAIATSNEIASYDMSKLQMVLDPITKTLGGKGGELFVKYGYGEITKGQIRILQAHGNNTEWVVKSNEFVSDFLPKGWHSKDNAGKINGVKITKGELIKAYIETHLAPVNAENINYGGYHTEDKQGRPVWFYQGEGHLEQLKADIDALMTPETIKLAENLHYKVINEYLQSKFVDFKKESGYVDVDLVKDYSTLHKDSYFQTSIDKRVIGDPSFRYGLKRTEDLSALGVVDIMDEIGDYIKRIGQQIYLKPAVHDFYALLNSKDSNGISVAQHISEKYGRNELKYLTDITDQWIIKNPESQNFITKTTALFMSGYATSKISSPIRSVKNYLSHTTSNIDLAKMVKLSKYGKEVREAAHMLIDEVIPELKYRSASQELLKGNAPTTFSGISGKIQSIVMSPVKFWDKLAMDSGLLDIVNDCLKNGVDVNSVEGKQYVRDMYSLYNMLNVGSTPLHQNLLNDNAITRMTFNVLAGAMRANVASYAVQGSLYHQFHNVDEAQLKADLENALAKYEEAQKVTSKAEEAYNNGLKQLDTLREERDNLLNNKKEQQLGIVNKYNPMEDSYHVGIRKVEDIKTWEEVLALNDEKEGQFAWGDFSREDAQKALESGKITIYSSKEIEQGTFVSTSKIQAEEYAGGQGSKIYSKEIELNKVAWINGDEGQFADTSVEEDINGLIAEARAKVNEQRATNKTLKENLNNAREEEYKANGEAKTQQNKSDGYKQYKFSGGKRIPLNILAKMIINGIAVTAVGMLANFLYGKKKFSEYKAEEILTTVATNSFLNWIPVVGTLTGTVLNGYEIDAPSISMLNDLGQVAHNIYSSIVEGKVSGALLTGLISILEGLTGLPIDEIKKYIYGITKLIDSEAALKFNNIFYASTVNGLTKSYNQYIESGDTKSAQAYLSYMVSEFKGGVTNDQINAELVILSSQGYNAIPRSIPTAYTDDNGNQIQLTAAQITQFKKLYQQSENQVVKVMNTPEYRVATSEEKAKLISSVYNAYYGFAKARAIGSSGSSKLENLLVLTNGNVELAKYISILQKTGSITETKKKSRKELVIDYINKLQMSKQEKVLLMYLAGYSVTGNSQKTLISFLMSKGASHKDALTYVGVKD